MAQGASPTQQSRADVRAREAEELVAVWTAAGMPIGDVAELQYAFPTFTEGVGQAAQKLVRDLGLRPMPQLWSSLGEPGLWQGAQA
jgi:hypothetical protein